MKRLFSVLNITSAIFVAFLTGCAGPQIDPKILAQMEPAELIQTFAKERPIQLGFRNRVIESVEHIHTGNFVVHQTHYVIAGLGEDWPAYREIKTMCEAKGGIFPDKSFGQANPHKQGLPVIYSTNKSFAPERSDCLSLKDEQLIFSVFRSLSSPFPLSMGGLAQYNLIAIAVPKFSGNIDPAKELRMRQRELPHNYLPRSTVVMWAVDRT